MSVTTGCRTRWLAGLSTVTTLLACSPIAAQGESEAVQHLTAMKAVLTREAKDAGPVVGVHFPTFRQSAIKLLPHAFDDANTRTTASALASLKHLRVLDGTATQLNDAAMSAVAKLPGLTTLRLSQSKVTNAAFDQSDSWPVLSEIDLSNTAVTDTTATFLANVKSLRAVNVSQTGVTSKGLREILATGRLHRFEMRGGRLTADLAKVLAKNEGLTCLVLEQCLIDRPAVRELGKLVGLEGVFFPASRFVEESAPTPPTKGMWGNPETFTAAFSATWADPSTLQAWLRGCPKLRALSIRQFARRIPAQGVHRFDGQSPRARCLACRVGRLRDARPHDELQSPLL
jgi:hypothetical protein